MDDKIGFPFPTTSSKQTSAPIVSKPQEKAALEGWSWGAFMFGPMFLVGVKKYYYLFVYLVFFIPLINFIVFIGFAIYLGIKGKQLAYESSMFENNSEAEGFIKAVDHAGKIWFIISVILFVLWLAFFVTIFSTFFSSFNKMRNSPQNNAFSSQQNLQATQQLTTLGGYLGMYKSIYKKYPVSLSLLISTYPDKNLSQIDPWGDAIHYTMNADGTVTLKSDGPDKISNTNDDIPFTYPIVYK